MPARAGQMIDATFVEVPKQRNSREENIQIKEGQVPEAWDHVDAQAKRRQKDTDARWTRKTTRNITAIKITSTLTKATSLYKTMLLHRHRFTTVKCLMNCLTKPLMQMAINDRYMPIAHTIQKSRSNA